MACNQTLGGLILDCSSSVGGIKAVYIANYADVTAIEYDGETITNFTMSGETKFKKYEFRKQTGSMTSTLNVDEQAGVNYVSTELNLVFAKMETQKRLEISALSKGQLAVIVKDGNDNYFYLGVNDYVSATAGSGATGQSKGDSNNYSITLKDESDDYPPLIDKTVVEDVVDRL